MLTEEIKKQFFSKNVMFQRNTLLKFVEFLENHKDYSKHFWKWYEDTFLTTEEEW